MKSLIGTLLVTCCCASSASAATERLYWTDSQIGTIHRAKLDGTGVELLVSGLSNPQDIVIDSVAGKMYWSDVTTDKIQRANLDGTEVENFLVGLDDPIGMAIDEVSRELYWVDGSERSVRRTSLDGSSVQTVLSTGQPHDLAINATDGFLYWTDTAGGIISRYPVAGGSVQTLVTGLSAPEMITFDYTNSLMYWTDDGGRAAIERSGFDGSNPELVHAAGAFPLGIAVSPSRQEVYWADPARDAIQAFSLTTQLPSPLILSPPNPAFLIIGPVPEPSTALLFTVLFFAGSNRARRLG